MGLQLDIVTAELNQFVLQTFGSFLSPHANLFGRPGTLPGIRSRLGRVPTAQHIFSITTETFKAGPLDLRTNLVVKSNAYCR